MQRNEFSQDTIRAIIQLLDSPMTLAALADVFSAECQEEKVMASREALKNAPELAVIVRHEARSSAFSEVLEVIRRAVGL